MDRAVLDFVKEHVFDPPILSSGATEFAGLFRKWREWSWREFRNSNPPHPRKRRRLRWQEGYNRPQGGHVKLGNKRPSASRVRQVLRLRDGPDCGVRNVFKRRHQLFTRDAFALQHQT
jgi:hypothetical protein